MKLALCIIAATVGVASAAPARAATLVIPRLHLRVHVGTSLDVGPAWWPGSRNEIAGHRVTHTHPFRHLDALRAGDVIYLGANTYRVTSSRTFPEGANYATPRAGHLLLSTCNPPGSSAQRLVVFAVRDFNGWTEVH